MISCVHFPQKSFWLFADDINLSKRIAFDMNQLHWTSPIKIVTAEVITGSVKNHSSEKKDNTKRIPTWIHLFVQFLKRHESKEPDPHITCPTHCIVSWFMLLSLCFELSQPRGSISGLINSRTCNYNQMTVKSFNTRHEQLISSFLYHLMDRWLTQPLSFMAIKAETISLKKSR